MVTLYFDQTDNRYTKMVNGKRFRSARGATKAEAVEAYHNWWSEKFNPQWIAEHNAAHQTMSEGFQSAAVALNSIGMEVDQVPLDQLATMATSAIMKPRAKAGRHTIKALTKEFLEFKSKGAKKISVGRQNVIRVHLDIFNESCGLLTPKEVDRDNWKTFHDKLQTNLDSKKWAAKYANDVLGTVRGFFRWLEADDLIDQVPKYVVSNLYSIPVPTTKVEKFTDDELAMVLKKSSGLLKLSVLLMLNVGATQEDLSQLDWNQIDMEAGTLTRKRTKHKHREGSANDKSPTVTYHLWPECVKGLEELLGNRSGRVLSTPSGIELVSNNRRDYLAQMYRKQGLPKSLKYCRKTGTTAMGVEYKPYREMYLANAPESVTDKSYDANDQLPKKITDHIRKTLKIAK